MARAEFLSAAPRAGKPCFAKVRYRSRRDAKEQMLSMAKHKGFRRTEFAVYRCDECEHWHFGHRIAARRAR